MQLLQKVQLPKDLFNSKFNLLKQQAEKRIEAELAELQVKIQAAVGEAKAELLILEADLKAKLADLKTKAQDVLNDPKVLQFMQNVAEVLNSQDHPE